MSILTMMASTRTIIWTALIAWSAQAASQSLPYIPTTILPLSDSWACENHTNHGLYIFSPTDSSVDLLFLNTSSKLDASSLKPRVLTSDLPFVDQSRTAAFTASVTDDGSLSVFAGDCAAPGNEAIWTFGQPISSSSSGWVKHAAPQSGTATTTPGAPFLLGGSLSFSSTIAPALSEPVTYVYGGMCPWTNSTAATWQSSATYSNRMLKVSPSSSREGTIYSAESTSSPGPPIAEAGFTFTPLTPALSNRSGTVSQTISHVLLGGHTQKAFINMSTAAVWNLPEETWNIVYINPPAATYGNTELAIKAVAGSVESRSGHTAVLNEDGTALVIYGGWVGDLSQAATPQLVVLEMGSSLADWQWSIPEKQPTGPGIHGHGAVLLPGNVMMVYGGYATSSTARRATEQQRMFLNLTSLTWSDQYTNPTPPTSSATIPHSSTTVPSPTASSSTTSGARSSNLALGLGLGLGGPALILLIALAIWFRRRQRQRHRHEEVVRGLAQDARRFLSADDDEMIENEHFGSNWFPTSWKGGTATQEWYTGGGDPYVRGSRSLGYETLRGNRAGTSYPPIPPTAAPGLNRSRGAAKGLYLPATGIGSGGGYEFGPGGGKAGIHPIYEAEDEDGEGTAAGAAAGRSTNISPEHPSDDASASDPFVTPATTPRGPGPNGGIYFPLPPPSRSSATPSPEHIRTVVHRPQDAEVQEWVSDIDAADAVLTARIGPHGGTTTTTPSLTPPKQTTRPARSRRNSLSFPLEGDEARTGSNLSESARSNFSFVGGPSRSDSVRVAGPAAVGEVKRNGSSSGSSSHTYNTAKTHGNGGGSGGGGFTGLREEGPSLLLGTASRGYSPEHRDGDSPPGSPSKHKPRRSWLGSLRRVFSGSGTPEGSSRTESPDGGGGGSGSDYEPRLVGMGPDGRLLRRKQGKDAWVANHGDEDDDEWDVERAVEQRLVQIMFTVPKERLRVVNAEVEREEEGEIVDPEREMWPDAEVEETGNGTRYRREGHGQRQVGNPEKEALKRGEEAGVYSGEHEHGEEKQHLPQDHKDRHQYVTDPEKLSLQREESHQEHDTLLDVPEQERRPSTPLSPVTLHTAEMVRMERPSKTKLLDVKESIESLEKPKPLDIKESVETPEKPRTKVLQMVESIESMSRGGSPAASPAREK